MHILCNTLMIISDYKLKEFFYSTQTDTLYHRERDIDEWKKNCSGACAAGTNKYCPVKYPDTYTFTQIKDGIPNVYPEGHTPPKKEEEIDIMENEDVAVLKEMDVDQLIIECVRRRKVTETIWQAISKYHGFMGMSDIHTYLHNRRIREQEIGENNIGDGWFVFQLKLAGDIVKILRKRKVLDQDHRGDAYIQGLIEGTIHKALME